MTQIYFSGTYQVHGSFEKIEKISTESRAAIPSTINTN